jgi:hypothetical protein
MNAKILTLTCSLISAATLGLAQDPAPQPAPPAEPAEKAPAVEESKELTKDEFIPDKAPRPRRKEVRIERRGPGNRVHIEEHTESGDVVREFDGHGAPGVFEKHVEPLDNESGDVHIERRIIRGPNQNEDVIIRRGPARLELRGPGIPDGPVALPMRPLDKEQAEHLEQAIRHLHDAGMDELANRLQARLDNQRGGRGDEARLRGEIERLKEEHQKLQKELRKLQKQMNKPEKLEKNEKE